MQTTIEIIAAQLELGTTPNELVLKETQISKLAEENNLVISEIHTLRLTLLLL